MISEDACPAELADKVFFTITGANIQKLCEIEKDFKKKLSLWLV